MTGARYVPGALKRYWGAAAAIVVLATGAILYRTCGDKTTKTLGFRERNPYGNVVSSGYAKEDYYARCFREDEVVRETYMDIDNDGAVDICSRNHYIVTPIGLIPDDGKTYFFYRDSAEYEELLGMSESFLPMNEVKAKRKGSFKAMGTQKKFNELRRQEAEKRESEAKDDATISL